MRYSSTREPPSSGRAQGDGLGRESCEGSSSADQAQGAGPLRFSGSSSADQAQGAGPLRISCANQGSSPGRAGSPPDMGKPGVEDVVEGVEEVDGVLSKPAEADCAWPRVPLASSPPRTGRWRVGGSRFPSRGMAGAGHARRPNPRPWLASRDGGAEIRFATHRSHARCTSRTILSQYNSVRLHTEPLAIKCS